MKRFAALVCAGLFLGYAEAGLIDGTEDFSLDPDVNAAGALTPGQINWSPEDGTWGDDFVIAPLEPGDEIDALSSHHRSNPWQHNVSLERMIKGPLNMDFSVDNDSNIFEWEISGPEPVPNGPGRIATLDGHFPATQPNPINAQLAHDSAADLGLENLDLDALEHHDHIPPYPNPFPGAPTNWEDNPANVYYSTERGPTDPGDVFNWGGGLYVDDSWICAALVSTGYTCDDNLFNIDGLIVYDIAGSLEGFDVGTSKFDSDAIFFSVTPGSIGQDAIGDNVWWFSAFSLAGPAVAGLYHDPQLDVNVDALDVHVPEPSSLALMGLGLAGIGYRRRHRSKTAA